MSEMTADQFAQLAYQLDLVTENQINRAWNVLGTENATRSEFISELQRDGAITNFQADRLLEGRRTGYFYGQWKVLYLVGAGTFARVYRGVNKETGEVRAIKVLRKRFSEDANATDQFLHEAKMVMPLKHPNIVPVFEVERSRDGIYMVMDFVEGRNLRDFMKIRKKFTLDEALRIGLDVVNGLDFAFMHGVLHRDMKLSNILLSSSGRALLVDFGLAAMEQLASAEGTNNPRSVDYVALERVTNVRRGDKRSDMYFMGGILYQLFSGNSPWPETKDRMARMSSDRYTSVRPLAEVDSKIPNRLSSIVLRAMDLNSEKRYQQPSELKRDLETSLDMLRRGVLETAAAATLGPGAGGESDQYEGEGRTILLIDNHAEMQDLVRDGLKKRGYRVLIIANPERARERFGDGTVSVDAVILNASRLGHEAFSTAKAFLGDDTVGNVPIVLLVSGHQAAQVSTLPNAQRVHALTMPAKMSQVRKTLQEIMPRRST